MDSLLIVGVETVVGANLASTLAEEVAVVGLSREPGVALDGVDVELLADETEAAARQALAAARPSRLVICGRAARSSWEPMEPGALESDRPAADAWTRAAADAGIPLTLVSTDAVFTGPWMFHRENSTSLCPSADAAAARDVESRTLELCPEALVVRTNAFGWSPLGETGWIEAALGSLSVRTSVSLDCLRHATPILATDLAGLLRDCWSRDLSGVWHIAGSERVNPARFVEQLADRFELPAPLRCRIEPLENRPEGFGRGETSLHTKKIRRTLDVSLPTVAEGLERLRVQRLTGHAERICPAGAPRMSCSRVA